MIECLKKPTCKYLNLRILAVSKDWSKFDRILTGANPI